MIRDSAARVLVRMEETGGNEDSTDCSSQDG